MMQADAQPSLLGIDKASKANSPVNDVSVIDGRSKPVQFHFICWVQKAWTAGVAATQPFPESLRRA